MLSKTLNELRISMDIHPQGPLLIKDRERAGSGREKNQMYFIREWFLDKDNTGSIYIPGSTLKGAVRSRMEKILLSMPETEGMCCSGNNGGQTCRKTIEELNGKNKVNPYENSCEICRLFGNEYLKSKITFEDALPIEQKEIAEHCTIAIDRFSGKNLDPVILESAEKSSFNTTIIVKNFEAWQIGLLAYIFRDFYNNEIQLGSAKSRGYGIVKGIIKSVSYMEISDKDSNGKLNRIRGVGELDKNRKDIYKYPVGDGFEVIQDEWIIDSVNINPLYSLWRIKETESADYGKSSVWNFLECAAKAWNIKLKSKRGVGNEHLS